MSDIVDLTVTSIADTVYELQARVDAEPKADDVSRSDWQAVLFAVTELHLHVREKLTVATVPSDNINAPATVERPGAGTGGRSSHAPDTFTNGDAP